MESITLHPDCIKYLVVEMTAQIGQITQNLSDQQNITYIYRMADERFAEVEYVHLPMGQVSGKKGNLRFVRFIDDAEVLAESFKHENWFWLHDETYRIMILHDDDSVDMEPFRGEKP